MPTATLEKIIHEEYASFVGKTIHSIRPLRESELKSLYWDPCSGDVPMAIIFTDGQVLIPSSDPEANGPGFLIVADLSKE